MALIPLENAGQTGIVQDIQPWQLPINAWSDGNNVRMEHGSVMKCKGYTSVMATCPIAPYHIVYIKDAAGNKYWIACGLTAVHAYDVSGATWTDITRSSGAYTATSSEGWTSSVIGGVLILNNFKDAPQFWAISGTTGLPSTSTVLADLTNWTSTDRCKSMRAFRSFLVALNIEDKSSGTLRQSRVVKWSTEAAIQAVPTSWDETDATVDAGEYELADTKGDILDGLALRDTFMIYKEDAVYSMTYVGTPFIFSFRQLSPSVGILSKNCVAEFDGGHFLFGNGDLYLNDGQKITSLLPHKMRDHVFSLLDGDYIDKSFVVADYGRTEMLACFVSTSSGADNQCDKALIWNWVNNTFSIRDIPDLAHIGYGSIANPLSYTTWAATAALSPSPSGPSWSSATGAWATSWDDVENVMVFADPVSTKLYRDGSGNKKDTDNMTAFIERTGLTFTAQNNPDQSTVKRIKAIWPKMTITNSDSVNFYVASQMSTEEGISWRGPFAFNPDSQSKVSCRISGKLYGVKIESTTDTDWRLEGLEFELDDAGRRGSRNY